MKVFCDGGCEGNEQLDMTKRLMRVAVVDENGIVLVDKWKHGGTNNVAELWAIVEAMMFIDSCDLPKKEKRLDIFLDSVTGIAWAEGRANLNKLKDRESVETLLKVLTSLRMRIPVTFQWVPREQNLAGHFIEETYGI